MIKIQSLETGDFSIFAEQWCTIMKILSKTDGHEGSLNFFLKMNELPSIPETGFNHFLDKRSLLALSSICRRNKVIKDQLLQKNIFQNNYWQYCHLPKYVTKEGKISCGLSKKRYNSNKSRHYNIFFSQMLRLLKEIEDFCCQRSKQNIVHTNNFGEFRRPLRFKYCWKSRNDKKFSRLVVSMAARSIFVIYFHSHTIKFSQHLTTRHTTVDGHLPSQRPYTLPTTMETKLLLDLKAKQKTLRQMESICDELKKFVVHHKTSQLTRKK